MRAAMTAFAFFASLAVFAHLASFLQSVGQPWWMQVGACFAPSTVVACLAWRFTK